MNLYDLEAFVALGECGSVQHAARKLRLSQPAVTRRIQNFEAAIALGPLLDRSRKPPVLTAQGRRVFVQCLGVTASLRGLRSMAVAESVREFRLGVAQGMGALALQAPLDQLRRAHPNLQLRVESGWSATLIERVKRGALDGAVVVRYEQPAPVAGLETKFIGKAFPLQMVAAVDFPLKRRRSIRVQDVVDAPWILYPSGCSYRQILQEAFDRHGAALNVAMEVYERDLKLSLVARGLGVGLFSAAEVAASPHAKRLRLLPLEFIQQQFRMAVVHGQHAVGGLCTLVDTLHASISARLRS